MHELFVSGSLMTMEDVVRGGPSSFHTEAEQDPHLLLFLMFLKTILSTSSLSMVRFRFSAVSSMSTIV